MCLKLRAGLKKSEKRCNWAGDFLLQVCVRISTKLEVLLCRHYQHLLGGQLTSKTTRKTQQSNSTEIQYYQGFQDHGGIAVGRRWWRLRRSAPRNENGPGWTSLLKSQNSFLQLIICCCRIMRDKLKHHLWVGDKSRKSVLVPVVFIFTLKFMVNLDYLFSDCSATDTTKN